MLNSKTTWTLLALATVAGLAGSANAAIITKQNNTSALNLDTSWFGGVAATSSDTVVWNSSVTAANTVALGGNVSWGGIQITNPGGGAVVVTHASGNVLTLGAGGIDMSTATQNLTLMNSANVAGNIAIGASQTWNVASGRTLTLWSNSNTANQRLTGSGNIEITGGGIVRVLTGDAGTTTFTAGNGNDTYSGNWTITSGSVRGLRNGTHAWGTGTIYMNGGTIGQEQGGWAWSNNIVLNTGTTSTFDDFNTSGTTRTLKLQGVISGSGNLNIADTSSRMDANTGFILTGSNTMSGTITIGASGNLRVGGVTGNDNSTTAGTGGTLGTASVNLNSTTATLTFSRSDALTVANSISGSGTVNIGGAVSGAGTQVLTLSGTNNYTGATTVGAGTVVFAKQVSLYNNNTTSWTAANLVVNASATAAFNVGGAGEFTSSDIDTIKALGGASNGFMNGSNIGFNTTNAGGNFTYSSAIANTNAGANVIGLAKLGTGTLTLSGLNTYTGTSTLAGGTLNLNAVETAGTSGPLGKSTAVGSILLTGGTLQYSASNQYDYSGRFSTAASQQYNVDTNGQAVTWATALTSSSGSLTKSGTGTLTLSGNNTYTGNTTISGGVLALASSGKLYNGAWNGSAVITVGAGGTWLLPDYSYGGVGQLADYATSRVLNGGTIEVTGTTQSSGQDFTVSASGGTFRYNPTNTSDTLSLVGNGNGNITLNGLLTLDAIGNIKITGTGGATDGIIAGTGSLAKTGSGTLTLGGANTYSGSTTIGAGVVNLAVAQNGTANGPLGTSGTITLNGGYLQYSSANQNDYSSRFSTAAGQQYKVDTNNQAVTWATGLTSSGGLLTKAGTGTLTLSGSNTYAGTTSINAGMLMLTGSLASGSAVTVANGAILAGTGTAGGNVAVSSGGVLTPGVAGSGVLKLGSLTLGATAGDTATINIGVSGTPGSAVTSSSLLVNGDVTANGGAGKVTFAFGSALANLGNGTYSLITYTGTQLADVSAFAYSGTTGARQTPSLVNGTKTVDLYVTAAWPIWTGVAGSDWSAATGNWKLNSDSSDTYFMANDTVHFDSSASNGTVNLTADVAPISVAFEGNTLDYTLGSTGGYKITSGLLNKSGSSTLTINNPNTFGGGTTIGAGVVVLGDAGALGSGAIALNGGSLNINGKTIANNVVLGGGTLAGNGGTISGVVSEAGGSRSLTVGSSLTLTGTNTFSGATSINAGTLEIGGSGSLNNGTYAGTVSNSGTLKINSTANQLLSGTISGTGALIKANSGELTLSGSNSYNGGTTLTAGTLRVSGYDAALGTGVVTVSGGSTLATANGGGARALANNISINSGVTLSVDGGYATLTLNGVVSGQGNFAQYSTGTVLLNGTNTYTGTTATASGGTLEIGGSGVLNEGNYAGNITNVGTLKFSTSANQVLSGIISSTGVLAKSGSGTLTLSGANGYTGATTVSGGMLVANNATALGSSSALTVSGTGVLKLDAPVGVKSLANSASDTGAVVNFNGQTLTIGNATAGNNGTFYYGGLTGTGTLALRGGAGTVGNADGTAGAATGNYQIFTMATAQVQATSAFALDTGASATNRKDFAFINDTSDVLTLSSLTGYGAIRNDAGGSGTVTRLITVDQSGGDTTFNGALLSHKSGAGVVRALTLEKKGTSALTLAGFVGKETVSSSAGAAAVNLIANGGILDVTNAYNTTTTNTDAINIGTVTVTSGTLGFANQALINTAGNKGATSISMNGGTLRWDTGNTQDITAGGRLTLVDAKTATFDTNGNNVKLATALGGGAIGASVTKAGSGILTITASNSYTGATTITSGTLQIGDGTTDGSIASSSGITNNSALVYNLVGGRTYANSIDGIGTLTKSGSGTLTLSGSNSYSGATTVNAGMLAISSINAVGGTSGISLGNGTTLRYTGSGETLGKNITVSSGTGIVSNTGSGTLELSGTLTKTGTVLTLTGSSPINVTGTIVGTTGSFNSDLVVTATTVTLSNTNSYVGPTYVYNGGTLENGIANALPTDTVLTLGDASNTAGTYKLNGYSQSIAGLTNAGSGAALVANGGATDSTLTLTGTGAYAYGGLIQDGGAGKLALAVNTTGSYTLSGSNSYSGGTTLTAGTLVAGNANAFGTGAITVNSGSTLNLSNLAVANNITFNPGATLLGANGAYTGTNTVVSGATLNTTGQNIGGTTNISGTVTGSGTLGITNVLTGGTLSGAGTVGALTISGGTLSPGNSPGVLTATGDTAWTSGSYLWEVGEVDPLVKDQSNSPLKFDQFITSGALTIQDGFVINLANLAEPTNWDANKEYSWVIAHAGGALTINDLALLNTNMNTAGFTWGSAESSWSLTQSGNDLVLNYMVPEPGTLGLLALGALALLGRRRNRR